LKRRARRTTKCPKLCQPPQGAVRLAALLSYASFTEHSKGNNMLRNIVKLCEDKLGASDGDIGSVEDFYFDDHRWTVRYVVANTGSWMSGRLVLISPHAFGKFYEAGDALKVNLTRKQIEDSPSIDAHKPVSRQFEEEYHKYYGWPNYWQGGMMWGVSDYPFATPPEGSLPEVHASSEAEPVGFGDPHLRSAKAVIGYQIRATDEVIGHVTDFVMDDRNWSIKQMVVDTRKWLPGKRVLIAPAQINRISWEESQVHVNMTKDTLLKAPLFSVASLNSVKADPHQTA
jgi:uncharacterized protein YrrD